MARKTGKGNKKRSLENQDDKSSQMETNFTPNKRFASAEATTCNSSRSESKIDIVLELANSVFRCTVKGFCLLLDNGGQFKSSFRTSCNDLATKPDWKRGNAGSTVENSWKSEYYNILQEKFAVKFPDDFFQLHQYLQDSKNSPLDVLGLNLTGAYDLLNGKIQKENSFSKAELHLHGRFYHDIPEMMTVLYDGTVNNSFHIAYFRDDPKDEEIFLVSNKGKQNGELEICGDNLFAAIYIYGKNMLKTSTDRDKKKQLNLIMNEIEKESKNYGYSLEAVTSTIRKRNKNINSKCFHKIGMVVPVDKTEVGYRELPKTDRELKQVLKKLYETENESIKNECLDELQEIITLIQFANDECDYGMGYEFGIDLFIYGGDITHGMISHVLILAYELLKRDLFGEILEKHLENRQKSGPISITNNAKKQDLQ